MLRHPSIARRNRGAGRQTGRSAIGSKRGQTLIYIVIVLVVLFFVILAIYDTHHIITQRVRAQNGADSAALTGAKWQGAALNMIGELNLLKTTTAIYTDVPPGLSGTPSAQQIVDSLTEMQRRLAFAGPMLGMVQAQEGAKLNKIRARPALEARIHRRADFLRRLADQGAVTQTGYPGWPYDYADMLDTMADAGMAAEFINAQFAYGWLEFSNPIAAEYLGREAFYQAIASRDWCFLKDLLLNQNYTDYTFWGSVTVHLPPLEGSEFLNLGITFQSNAWLTGNDGSGGALSAAEISDLRSVLGEMARDRNISLNPNWPTFNTATWPAFNRPAGGLPQGTSLVNLTWAVFDSQRWREFAQDADVPPPKDVLVGDIKPEYNYSGADSSARVAIEPNITLSLRPRSETQTALQQPRTDWLPSDSRGAIQQDLSDLRQLSEQETVVSTAAAKPFGKISIDGQNYTPNAFRVVLPVFETVRLIPLVYSSGGNGFDENWSEHKFFHLPTYLQFGLDGLAPGCFYCGMLRLWEDAAFRQIGIEWLTANPRGCDPPPPPPLPPWSPPPGGGGGGGGGRVNPPPPPPPPPPRGVPIAH